MIYLNKEDYFEVYLASMISPSDRDTLFTLYQPFLGHDAVGLYFSLYSEFKKQEMTPVSSVSDLLETMDIPIDRLQEARKMLEGIGLVQTYYKKEKEQAYYKFLLFAPKSPSDFFADVILRGLLVRAIGARKANRLAHLYKSKELKLDGYNEITCSFNEVFRPDLDSDAFLSRLDADTTYTRKSKDITEGFDRGAFLSELEKQYRIRASALKKDDLETIVQIALLYGVGELAMSEIVSRCLNENGIDFEKVKKLSLEDHRFIPERKRAGVKSKEIYDGKGRKAQLIALMSSTSALDFLSYRQNHSKPSPSDVRLLNDLMETYGFSSQVINPIIAYVLENYDNTLPYNLVMKIASSLKREGIETTLDAMNYLYRTRKNQKKRPSVKENEEKPVSQNDVDDLFKELGDE